MRKSLLLSILVIPLLFSFTGCKEDQPEIAAEKIPETEVRKKSITDLLDQYHTAFRNKNAAGMSSLLADNGLYCGTDAKELWDKKTFTDFLTGAFADTSMGAINYQIANREIRISNSGSSALVMEQFTMDVVFSPKTPLRMVSNVIKEGEAWKIDFTSLNLIPHNEDLPKIAKALE